MWHEWSNGLIILVTLLGVAIGRLPWLRMNRATIVVVGAVALVLNQALTLEQAYQALDMNTILLLFGMMILNANLRLAGFFALATNWVIQHARSPRQLLALLVATSGTLAAIFLNDTVVLVMTPLLLELTLALKIPPLPYLLALALAANIGSTATMIGNPQNMIIGVASGLPFSEFTLRQLPVAVLGLVIAWAVVVVIYRHELPATPFAIPTLPQPRLFRPLLRKSLIATLLLLLLLLSGVPVPLAAMTSAALLLVTRRIKPERVFREIDWTLLVFFAGLFIVTHGVERLGIGSALLTTMAPWIAQGGAALTVVAVLLSNLISNVPAVLLLKPAILASEHPQPAWLVLAMATTLAGNLTLLGSVCNLIVAESARRHGVTISFLAYLKVGLPTTLLTLAWGGYWLASP